MAGAAGESLPLPFFTGLEDRKLMTPQRVAAPTRFTPLDGEMSEAHTRLGKKHQQGGIARLLPQATAHLTSLCFRRWASILCSGRGKCTVEREHTVQGWPGVCFGPAVPHEC